jgi:hypothetical protein
MVGKPGKPAWRRWALGAASVAGLALLAWFALRGSELPEPDRDLRLQYEAQERKAQEDTMAARGLASYLARSVCAIAPETYGPMEGRTQRHLREDPTLAAAMERGRREAEQDWRAAQAANREAAFRASHCPGLLAVLQRHIDD